MSIVFDPAYILYGQSGPTRTDSASPGVSFPVSKKRLWLKAVTEPNSVRHTAIAEWIRPESTENDGSVRFSDTGI